MLQRLKTVVKDMGRAIIPAPLFRAAQPVYHGCNALLASWWYGHPGSKLTVIGVTGTAGKSTTVNLLAHLLNQTGHKTGFITTANSYDGSNEQVNMHGLSMPGGWLLQRQLAAMVAAGCTYAVVEATSEGLAQHRHWGIRFTAALITNLSPAHLDNHRGFENYKAAKGLLFKALAEGKAAHTISGVNFDNQYYEYFRQFPASVHFGVTLHHAAAEGDTVYAAEDIALDPHVAFTLRGTRFETNLLGEFNVSNALLAVGCANLLGVALADSAAALKTFGQVPGRMQHIPNNRGIRIFVDYAPEPVAMQNALSAVGRMPHRLLIHVFGSTGGFRDVQKRFDFGAISAKAADVIIITNDDVYDSDPELIARNIENGIRSVPEGERKVSRVSTILDRRAAIAEALAVAQPQDIVIITGKGSEQFLVLPGNKRIKWDEPAVVQEELAKLTA
jgi:UDP-N-acetylmuramoyl-L-alanyl-D-glutamate--2,6-diaminopimelate ligase